MNSFFKQRMAKQALEKTTLAFKRPRMQYREPMLIY